MHGQHNIKKLPSEGFAAVNFMTVFFFVLLMWSDIILSYVMFIIIIIIIIIIIWAFIHYT